MINNCYNIPSSANKVIVLKFSEKYKNRSELLFFLLLFTVLIGAARIGKLTWNWDDGIHIFEGWRLFLNEIPNIDFISGYPGGQALLLSLLFRLLGPSVEAYHIFCVSLSVFLVISVFFTVSHFVKPAYAFAASLISLMFSPLFFWIPNPAMTVQAIMLLVFLNVIKWIESKKVIFLIVAGILTGLCFTFRQTAIFIVVALLAIICFKHAISAGNVGIKKGLFFSAPNVIIFIVFFYLRAIHRYPPRNFLVLLPWLVAVVFIATVSSKYRPSPVPFSKILMLYVQDLLILAISIIFGMIPIIVWYLYHNASLAHVLSEAFIRVPKLIDRCVGHMSVPDLNLVDVIFWSVSIGLVVTEGLIRLIKKDIGVFFIRLAWIVFGCFVSFGVLCFVKGPVSLLGENTGERVLELVWPMSYRWQWWDAPIVWFSLSILIVWLFLSFTKYSGDISWPEDSETGMLVKIFSVVSIFGAVTTATMFPYPWISYLTAIFLVCYIALGSTIIKIIDKLNETKDITAKRTKITNPLRAIVLAVALFAIVISEKWAVKREYPFRVDQARWQGWVIKTDKPFVNLSQELKMLPPNDTVVGYPNLALSLFLADKKPPTSQGNYIGNFEENMDAFINEIHSKKVDWVVINRTCYPYGTHPFFISSESFLKRLGVGYMLDHSVSHFDFYRRNIRK